MNKLIKFLRDWYKGRVYYVVRVSETEAQDDGMCNADNPAHRCVCREEFGHRVCKPVALPYDDVAICDCHVFGGVPDFGLFKRRSEAREFAEWRENFSHYGRGYLYTVDRATDAEVDGYIYSLTFYGETA